MLRARRLPLLLFIVLLILWLLLLLYPVRNGITRPALITTPAAILILLLTLWPRKRLRFLPLIPPLALGLFLSLPGRPHDPAALRAAYIAALERFEGTRYVWGGENHLGVDCSGLLRAALVDAHATESLRTLNPALARHALWLWWHDCSAAGLADGYQGQTLPLAPDTPPRALRDTPPDLLQSGDFAVTADGSHVMAYLGDSLWIEADPYPMRVIRLHLTDTSSPWLTTKVTPHRWRCLAP